MFNRKDDFPSSKPDPPKNYTPYFWVLIAIFVLFCARTNQQLDAINANLRDVATKQNACSPTLPLPPTYR